MSTDSAIKEAPAPAAVDSAKRRQIIEGARRVFLAQGFDGASMGEIARAAGVSKGTLYVYFDSKDALFEALTLEERASLAEVLFILDDGNPDVRDVLRRLGHSYLAMLVRPEHVSAVRMVIGAAEKFPRLGEMFYEAGPREGVSRLRVYLDRQVAAGRLRIKDTSIAAEQFIGLCASPVLRRVLFGAGGPPTAAEMEATVEAALDTFMAAFGSTK
ncbi:TetR/AcrR family transcriptional regulator [Salinarimonas soli]|uniref:TetR/AcrR family transcriptional regulator n=1 Tax=Salinarimonas soli TaxID=1638099 RepID=A0A5B2V831_9HYPH|nr:TetR/AcrR family transcriptional regulator [Salinarimonas soli]KAA2235194.1 TetR/AcrR family transcriptional regulator [Salinarimonas soli]